MTVQRFDFGIEYRGNTGVPGIVEKSDGRYVLYEDYAEQLAQHHRCYAELCRKCAESIVQADEIDGLREALEEINNTPQPVASGAHTKDKEVSGVQNANCETQTSAPAQEPSDDLMNALRNQRQIDRDGTEVGVSRQALDEAIALLACYGAAQPGVPLSSKPAPLSSMADQLCSKSEDPCES